MCSLKKPLSLATPTQPGISSARVQCYNKKHFHDVAVSMSMSENSSLPVVLDSADLFLFLGKCLNCLCHAVLLVGSNIKRHSSNNKAF